MGVNRLGGCEGPFKMGMENKNFSSQSLSVICLCGCSSNPISGGFNYIFAELQNISFTQRVRLATIGLAQNTC